jgi:hypothetical protein
MKAPRFLGLDGAIGYTILSRAMNMAGSAVTVLLIVRFLSPVEQGYYYTLLSLISLQMVFEMGFSFVIQQLAAHESAHLELHAGGSISGNPEAHARLAAALQLSLRWYTVAALAMGAILAPLGVLFFTRHESVGSAQVAWQAPWLLAVTALMALLWCTPFYSFLEGCGQVRAVAALRFAQSLGGSLLAWAAMLAGHGLYAPSMVILGHVTIGLVFLASRRRLLTGLLRHPAKAGILNWGREVWPYQWRIAVSWMCSYFTVQIFIPILFAVRGAVEAGQMGMSLSIAGYMTILALAWTSTKATPFGRMVARREFQALDRLFLTTFWQSFAVYTAIAAAVIAAVALLPSLAPHLAARMLPVGLFALLILGAGANHVVQSLAILLRCFKQEPFLIQSLAVASLTLLLAALTAARWGDAGTALVYFAVTAGIALPSALLIFARARRAYLAGGAITASKAVDHGSQCSEGFLPIRISEGS